MRKNYRKILRRAQIFLAATEFLLQGIGCSVSGEEIPPRVNWPLRPN
jgi:hypothetical protein